MNIPIQYAETITKRREKFVRYFENSFRIIPVSFTMDQEDIFKYKKNEGIIFKFMKHFFFLKI